MAAGRKLQAEIDKVLKKVDEGLEEFGNIWNGVHNASQVNQREKFEAELKAQIKKLQRDREQIKTWLGDKGIKDKTALGEARKKIEIEMERFKEFERDSKTKNYSKEGLMKSDKVDPEEENRLRHRTWMKESIEKLEIQVDELDADIEVQITKKTEKKGKVDEGGVSHNKYIQDTHRWHVQKLEQLIRKLDNDEVDLDVLDDLKDSVDFYVEENSRAEGEFQEYDHVYEEFNLHEVEETENVPSTPVEKPKEEVPVEKKEPVAAVVPPPAKSIAVKASPHLKAQPKLPPPPAKEGELPEPAPAPAKPWPPMVSVWQNPPLPLPSPAPEKEKAPPAVNPGPPPKAGGLPAGILGARTAPSLPPPVQPAPDRPPPPGQAPVLNAPPNQPPPKPAPQMLPPTQAPPQPPLPSPPVGSPPRPLAGPAGAAPVAASMSAPPMPAPPPMPPPAPQAGEAAAAAAPGDGPPSSAPPPPPPPLLPPPPPSAAPTQSAPAVTAPVTKQPPVTPVPTAGSETQHTQWPSPIAGTVPAGPRQPPKAPPPPSEAPPPPSELPPPPPESGTAVGGAISSVESLLVASGLPAREVPISNSGFESGGLVSSLRPAEGASSSAASAPSEDACGSLSPRRLQALQLLAASHKHLPAPSDSRRSRKYVPRNPYVHVDAAGSPAYHMQPTRNYEDPAMFEKYDLDTLFFIFYYQQGSYQQHLAAKELKKLSWRYHTKYLTWFQRHEEPRLTAADYERGAYVYFDHDSGWCQRIKSDFTFEYQFLEDEPM
ncbi:unnamed protein product [Polarella glacialis]|uniref:CCR4-NOT transcription complex subunit 3 n=1 Tax=Polarella glacialis TaxID=89957 RepID=A0A813JIN3_POLGL|nr:unnamed protein product [Polarella glacialis]CAE8676078.1 unnamed protein product [Polarella glacialis]